MFSKRLKELRIERDLSQQKIADYLGITRQGYGKYEDGKSQPDQQSLVMLAKFFDVTTDYLLGKSNRTHVTESDEKAALIEEMARKYPDAEIMFDNLAGMTVEELKEVDDFIRFKLQKKGD